MDAQLKELEEEIGKVPLIVKKWADEDPDLKDWVTSMDKLIWKDGKLSRQTKKIIAICVAAASGTGTRSGLRRREHPALVSTTRGGRGTQGDLPARRYAGLYLWAHRNRRPDEKIIHPGSPGQPPPVRYHIR